MTRVSGDVGVTDRITQAVLDKKSFHKWVNDKVVGSTDPTVLTDATLYYDLLDREIVLIYSFDYGVTTNSDICHFEVGWCSATAGGGDFTAMMGHYEYSTPAAKTQSSSEQVLFPVPMRAAYDDGVRSVSIRCTAGDNSVAVSVAYCGIRCTK